MAKNSLFWLGDGVININGKDYGAEMPLPVDEINTDDLKKMKADGRIGAKIAPVVVECAECAGHKSTIKGKDILIVELESEVERLTGEIKERDGLKAVHVKAHADAAAKKTKDGKK